MLMNLIKLFGKIMCLGITRSTWFTYIAYLDWLPWQAPIFGWCMEHPDTVKEVRNHDPERLWFCRPGWGEEAGRTIVTQQENARLGNRGLLGGMAQESHHHFPLLLPRRRIWLGREINHLVSVRKSGAMSQCMHRKSQRKPVERGLLWDVYILNLPLVRSQT